MENVANVLLELVLSLFLCWHRCVFSFHIIHYVSLIIKT